MKVSRERAIAIAHQSMNFAEQYRPDLIEELQGTAEGANVSIDDLMLLQVRNQLTPDDDAACTSLSLQPDAGRCIVAQTWDNDPVLDEFTVVLTRRPEGKPATMVCTQAGLITYMGLSETGIGACVNTLPAPSRPVGVPHYFILREIYEAHSVNEAVESVSRAHRAIPANIMLATPQGPANLEVTLDSVHLLTPMAKEPLAHTNHCLHPDLVAINDKFPELIDSQPRKERIDRLLATTQGTVEELQAILSDHDRFPTSICRHSNDDPIYGFWQTVFALIIEPSERRMFISRGTPCSAPFEEYLLN